ncbi:SLATT domain-containing protein [Hymenobacter sp. YC55]|uniref:SLATT domain-containing protein n=1 Tax=Hymenobacter sp. YC55 TaxID=3034019 RepID=UPI0023F7B24F|nr:SLATT domain-containing protein [Hymenobacter sp. YC55]MDF7814183.1 SLATT domain-containing protein [Hymenobacter sp. YC55]
MLPALPSPVPPAFPLPPAELAALTDELSCPETKSPHFKVFDAAAQQAQKQWRALFRWSVFFLLVVSLCSAATGLGPWLVTQNVLSADPRVIRLFDAIGVALTMLGVALEVGLQVYWRRRLTPWVLTRQHAETLRSAAWLYVLDLPLPPGGQPVPAAPADAAWQQWVANLVAAEQRQLNPGGRPQPTLPAVEVEPTPELRAQRNRLRQVGLDDKLGVYCVARLDSQRTYFEKRAEQLRRKAQFWRYVSYGILLAAFGWNSLRLLAIVENWPTVMSFFNFNLFLVIIGSAGLVKAFVETEGLEPLAARYQHMSAALAARRRQCPLAPVTSDVFQFFITESERLLREETTTWSSRHG